jgi:hypothetical protein
VSHASHIVHVIMLAPNHTRCYRVCIHRVSIEPTHLCRGSKMLIGRIVGRSEKRNSVRKHLRSVTLGGVKSLSYYHDEWPQSIDIVSLPACHVPVARSWRVSFPSAGRRRSIPWWR